jgi:hypothetical protein
MEGSMYFPLDRPNNIVHQTCTECGHLFESRPNGEGAESLCDPCYQIQFQPIHIRQLERMSVRLRSRR